MCYDPPTSCDSFPNLIDPVYEYDHGGSPFKCSITGGYVYRGCMIPEIQGRYFFGDFCAGVIWSLEYDGATLTNLVDHSSELNINAGDLASFGQDNQGELYVTGYGSGKIFKIISPASEPDCSCCLVPGDSNRSNDVDISDLTFTVDFMFKNGVPPICFEEGDLDNSCQLDIADLTYRVYWMFTSTSLQLVCKTCN